MEETQKHYAKQKKQEPESTHCMISLLWYCRLISRDAKKIADCLALRAGMGIGRDARKPLEVTEMFMMGLYISQNLLNN